MLPAFDPAVLPQCQVLEPDQCCALDDMRIETLESTDLGVGYLITWQGRRIWFGGDVAHWDWPVLDAAAMTAPKAASVRKVVLKSRTTVMATVPSAAKAIRATATAASRNRSAATKIRPTDRVPTARSVMVIVRNVPKAVSKNRM